MDLQRTRNKTGGKPQPEWSTFPLSGQCQIPVDHDVDLCGAVSNGVDNLVHACLQRRLAGWETGRHCRWEDVFTSPVRFCAGTGF